jgi:hypothetical protein
MYARFSSSGNNPLAIILIILYFIGFTVGGMFYTIYAWAMSSILVTHILMFFYYAITSTITALTIAFLADRDIVKPFATTVGIIVFFILLGVLILFTFFYYEWYEFFSITIGTITTPLYIIFLPIFINDKFAKKTDYKIDKGLSSKRLSEITTQKESEIN